MLKIRRSRDRLIFNMGISILVRRHLYIETRISGQTTVTCLWTPRFYHYDVVWFQSTYRHKTEFKDSKSFSELSLTMCLLMAWLGLKYLKARRWSSASVYSYIYIYIVYLIKPLSFLILCLFIMDVYETYYRYVTGESLKHDWLCFRWSFSQYVRSI